MTTPITVTEAIEDAALFGSLPVFAELSTWRPWFDFLRAVYGLPLDEKGVARFCKHTGRGAYEPPEGGWSEVACICGRQSGKTRIASLLAAYEAMIAPRCRDGELYALLLAQDWRASIRASFSYLRALFDASPILRQSVIRTTFDTLDLENGMRVATYPCRPASIRGVRARIVVCDELAFFRSSEGYATDQEMLTAARPALATTHGKLIIISSPYGQSGALWELHRRHYGQDGDDVLIWQASAPEMNPTLGEDYLERMRRTDPIAYRAEVLGEFRAGLSTLLDPEAIAACVATDRLELPPVADLKYFGFCDPSGGRRDSYSVSIAHRDGERCIVDLVRGWKAPFNPKGVTAECAELLREYRISRVNGDRYAGEWPREAFRSEGIRYDVADKNKSELYLALVSVINSDRIEIPDNPTMLRELRSLERRRGPSGKDRVDHAPNSHDDLANALAGAVEIVLAKKSQVGWADVIGFGKPVGDS